MSELPAKLFYRIGEVAGLVGVEPHVLRYWEREFRTIRPTKSAKGQRVYSRKDVENLIRVRDLLYREGFTIAGAKKKLRGAEPISLPRLVESATDVEAAAPVEREVAAVRAPRTEPVVRAMPAPVRRRLEQLRSEVRAWLVELDESGRERAFVRAPDPREMLPPSRIPASRVDARVEVPRKSGSGRMVGARTDEA